MTRELQFGGRCKYAHARPTVVRLLRNNEGRFGQVQFASYPLHRPSVDPGSVGEDRERIPKKGNRRKDVYEIIG